MQAYQIQWLPWRLLLAPKSKLQYLEQIQYYLQFCRETQLPRSIFLILMIYLSYCLQCIIGRGVNVKPFINLIKEKTGKTEIAPDIKTIENSAEKIVRKQRIGEWQTPKEANNILRAIILVENPAEGRGILNELGDSVAEYDDYFRNPKGGYRGINVDIRLADGSLAELQIHTKNSNGNAEKIHSVYKEQ